MAAYAAVYARALVEVVENNRLEPQRVLSQLQDLESTFSESRELREVLFNPSFKFERRLAVVDGIAGRLGLQREVRNFVAVLMRNGRLHAFHDVVAQYRLEMAKRSGIAEAHVVSARALDAGERQQLEAEAAKLAGMQVNATFEEDAALLGGVVLRIGSTVYDGSLRGRMERMKEQLIAG